jgi:hypothetical protein
MGLFSTFYETSEQLHYHQPSSSLSHSLSLATWVAAKTLLRPHPTGDQYQEQQIPMVLS